MRRLIQEPKSPRSRVLDLARSVTVLRPRDLASIGVPREYLKRLCDDGLLNHPARGIYMLPAVEVTEHQSLIEACKRVPRGVVCLVSALRFPRTHDPGAARGVAGDRFQGLATQDRIPAAADRQVFAGDA